MNKQIFEVIVSEIEVERKVQDKRFGQLPRSLRPSFYLAVLTKKLGDIARAILEGNSKGYREELIQLAAVAIAAIEEFDTGESRFYLEDVCDPIVYPDASDAVIRQNDRAMLELSLNTKKEE
jgi:hypothetical protein